MFTYWRRLRCRLQTRPNPLLGLIYFQRPRRWVTGWTAAYHVGIRAQICFFGLPYKYSFSANVVSSLYAALLSRRSLNACQRWLPASQTYCLRVGGHSEFMNIYTVPFIYFARVPANSPIVLGCYIRYFLGIYIKLCKNYCEEKKKSGIRRNSSALLRHWNVKVSYGGWLTEWL